jgi:hypothetical protein
MNEKKRQASKRRLKLDRQVIRYLRNLSEDELGRVVGGQVYDSWTDPYCTRDCDPD